MTVNGIKTGNTILVPLRSAEDIAFPGMAVAVFPSDGRGKPDLAVITSIERDSDLDTLSLIPYKKLGFSVSDGQVVFHLIYKEFRRGDD